MTIQSAEITSHKPTSRYLSACPDPGYFRFADDPLSVLKARDSVEVTRALFKLIVPNRSALWEMAAQLGNAFDMVALKASFAGPASKALIQRRPVTTSADSTRQVNRNAVYRSR